MDLVEIAPTAQPPVCKIIQWSKFKYEYTKKGRAIKSNVVKVKEMRFKYNTDSGALEHKVETVKKFLKKKYKVKIFVQKARNYLQIDQNRYVVLLNQIITMLEDVAEVDTQPKQEGRSTFAILRPK